MKTIPLTKGYVTIVDDADYEWLSRWKWRAEVSPHRRAVYAVRKVRVNGRQVMARMHCLLLGVVAPDRGDHKNGNGLDNRRSNLRVASTTKNNVNVAPRRMNKSGYKGVTQDKARWRATISIANKDVHLGAFASPQLAAAAYDAAALRLHGEFAWTNAAHGLI